MFDASLVRSYSPEKYVFGPLRLEETGEVNALADFRDAQLNRSGAGVALAPTVAVAVGQPIGAAASMCGSSQGLDFQIHQTLRGEADHLTQEVGIGGP